MAGPFSEAQQAPGAAQPAPAQAPSPGQTAPQGGGGEEMIQGMEAATPEEQQAYDSAIQAITDIAFGNDQSHQQVLQFIADEMETTGPTGALVKCTAMLITEVDKQLNLPESVPINLADDVFVMLQELAEAANLFTLEDKEMKQGVGAAQQMLMEAYGGDLEGFEQTVGSLGENVLRDSLKTLEEIQ